MNKYKEEIVLLLGIFGIYSIFSFLLGKMWWHEKADLKTKIIFLLVLLYALQVNQNNKK